MNTEEIKNIIKDNLLQVQHDNRQLSQLIDEIFRPTDHQKKTFAEVSTPFALRQEMLNVVPTEFWSTPKKVFEPCSGKGGFLLDIIDRFMEGLKECIPDKDKRYQVIVEECLYFSEISSMNIYINRLLLDIDNKYTLNYNEGDTLKLNITENGDWMGLT